MGAQVSAIPLEELAPVFEGRAYVAELWQLLSAGRTDLSPAQQVELILAEMRVYEMRGDLATALQKCEQALELARRVAYRDGIIYALFSSAYMHHALGNYECSAKLARESLADDENSLYSGIGWRVLAQVARNTNDWAQAQTYFERAIGSTRRSGWTAGLVTTLLDFAMFYSDRGQFELAVAMTVEVQNLSVGLGNHNLFPPTNRAEICLQMGRRAQARQALDEAAGLMTGSELIKAFYRVNAAWLAIDEGDDQAAEAELQGARALAEAQGDAITLQHVRLYYSRLRRMQKDAPSALMWANEALAFAKGLTCRFEEGKALVARAHAWWLLDDRAAAETDLHSALAIANMLGAEYLAAETTFLLSVLYCQEGQAEADTTWLEAARRIRIGGYGFLLERERELAFPMLAEFAKSTHEGVRHAAEQALAQLTKVPPLPLRIVGLGRFEVWQGRRRIGDSDWPRRRAGELLRFLLLQPDHGAAREVVFEVLCPEQSPLAAQTFLHHATSSLRRILEPDLPEKFSSRYLRVENERVTLVLPSGSQVDFESFEQAIVATAMGQTAGSVSSRDEPLSAALLLYGGELFPADRYADWTVAPRERLADLHRRGLLALARQQLQAGSPQAALDACRQILSSDPWHEDAVSLAMQAYLALNNRPAALRLFLSLERTLHSELQLRPRKDLQELAASLRGA